MNGSAPGLVPGVPALDRGQRAAIHAALGEPLRLAMVDALTWSDRSPDELAAMLGIRSNLLAHHVSVLEEAGIVVRTVSHGDRRRRYLHLVHERLAQAWDPPARPARRVLFLCTQNSARSPLAAAMWNERSPVPALSAGTTPAECFHPGTVAAARREGLRLPGRRPVHREAISEPVDLVISVCDQARESLRGAEQPALHWSLPDPAVDGTSAAFDRAVALLRDRVEALAPRVVPAG